MLVDEIKMIVGYQIRGHLSKDKLERIAALKNVALTYKHCIKKKGWMGKPKGLLQVLWEQGFVDRNNLSSYSLKGLKEEFTKSSLGTLMSRWSDFANKKSAMEHLFIHLSKKAN